MTNIKNKRYDLYEVNDDFMNFLINKTGGIRTDNTGTNLMDNKVATRLFPRPYFGKIHDPNDLSWFYVVPFSSKATWLDGTPKLLPTAVTFIKITKDGKKKAYALAKFSGMIPIAVEYEKVLLEKNN